MIVTPVLATESVPPPIASKITAGTTWWRTPDYLVAVIATILIVFLHVCLTPNVGGLWRDEVNTVNLATLPKWQDLWRLHNQDSFPLLFAATVRIWSGWFGSGDDSVRILGLIIGLAVVAAFWVNARLTGLRFPFWSLVLAGANPMLIRYGDSARAYGLSLVFLLLMFGLIWKVANNPAWRWISLAAASAALSVHATYYNPVLLFAICAGAFAVALMKRNWRAMFAVIGIGALAAISLLPYVPTFLRADDWNFLVRYPFTLPFMWQRLSEVIGSPFSFEVILWVALVAAAIVAAVAPFARTGPQSKCVALFCGVALVMGIVSYTAFLKMLSYHTNPWYYLSFVTFVAVCIDPLLAPTGAGPHRPLRAAVAALLLAFTAVPTSQIVAARHTNLDLVGRQLENLAGPEDLIVLTTWQCGVTLNRYYKGPAAWTTVPPLPDFHFQSHQPIITQMQAEAPLRPIFQNIERVLKSGHRVWIVGGAPLPPPGRTPPALPRAGTDKNGWRGSEAFYTVWAMQVMYFLHLHITHAQKVRFPDVGPIGQFEHLDVSVFDGWK